MRPFVPVGRLRAIHVTLVGGWIVMPRRVVKPLFMKVTCALFCSPRLTLSSTYPTAGETMLITGTAGKRVRLAFNVPMAPSADFKLRTTCAEEGALASALSCRVTVCWELAAALRGEGDTSVAWMLEMGVVFVPTT